VEPLDDDLVIYDPSNGRAYVLNPTAALIWELCDGSMTIEGMADELKQEYGLEDETVLADVEALIAQLERAGLLEA
jgi:pyrroloquinoline quinone biosynthesis protein D